MISPKENNYKEILKASPEVVLVGLLLQKLINRVPIGEKFTWKKLFKEISYIRLEKKYFLLLLDCLEKHFPYEVKLSKGYIVLLPNWKDFNLNPKLRSRKTRVN